MSFFLFALIIKDITTYLYCYFSSFDLNFVIDNLPAHVFKYL